jgi:hypothetical protein
MLKKALAAGVATAALAMLAGPASATLRLAFSDGVNAFSCVDNAACDLDTDPNQISIGVTSVGKFSILGTFSASQNGPPILAAGNISITNTGTTAGTLKMAFGDNNFVGLNASFLASVGGQWLGAKGSDITSGFWVDGTNVEGAATATDTPGTEIASFANTALINTPVSFAYNPGPIGFIHAQPFSMTEGVILDLTAGGRVIGNLQSIEAVPEPRTWAMAGIGFALLGLVGLRKRSHRVIA